MPTFDQFKKLHKQLYDDLKKVSTDPHPLKFLAAFLRFFGVIAIEFFSLVLLITVIYGFVFAPFVENKRNHLVKKPCCYKMRKPHGEDVYKKMQQRLNDLENRVNNLEAAYGIEKEQAPNTETEDTTFWQNNEASYTYETPNYLINLSNDTRYIYVLSLCAKSGSQRCFDIVDRPTFYFDNTYVISGITATAYEITGIEGYIFAGNVQTNKGNLPFLVYPQLNTENTYAAVEELSFNMTQATLRYIGDINYERENKAGIRFLLAYPQQELEDNNLDVYVDESELELVHQISPANTQ